MLPSKPPSLPAAQREGGPVRAQQHAPLLPSTQPPMQAALQTQAGSPACLRDGGPVRELLDALPNLGVGQHVARAVLHACRVRSHTSIQAGASQEGSRSGSTLRETSRQAHMQSVNWLPVRCTAVAGTANTTTAAGAKATPRAAAACGAAGWHPQPPPTAQQQRTVQVEDGACHV